MNATAAASKFRTTELPTNTIIHIVGEKSLHTELLVEFLDKNLEFTCLHSPSNNLTALTGQVPNRTHLLFFDSNDVNQSTAFMSPDLKKVLYRPQCYVILYNVDPANGSEIETLRRGVRGIIYAHRPLEIFPRAALAVLKGELWYPRGILTEFILTTERPICAPEETCACLTSREREIVTKLAEGYSNRKIARHFGISPNTVRTHVYKIYKKINVSNRLQASMWLANNS